MVTGAVCFCPEEISSHFGEAGVAVSVKVEPKTVELETVMVTVRATFPKV